MNRIIVSLTSYPARIKNIQWVLDSIVAQTYKPDKVVLYLSEDQFVEKRLPINLSSYFEQDLEIHWCQGDMKSHKKYLYAFSEYSDDYIITIDDDCYYEKHMIEEFVQYMDKFPRCVLARRTHLITAKSDGSISSYEKWWSECMHYTCAPRKDLVAVGCGGILYPPYLLIDEVFNADNIKKYCMYADDIWLKVMELISEVSVVQVPTRLLDRFDDEFAKDGLYQQHNGKGGNDRQLQTLLEFYDKFDGLDLALIEKIFSTGIIYEDKVFQIQKKDNLRMAQEWMADIVSSGCDIVIYGAGTVARRIYELLKRYNAIEKIKCFVVEDIAENVAAIENIKVVQYKAADYTNAVCIIAVAKLAERYCVNDKLQKMGIAEEKILLLNDKLYRALRELEKENV